MTGAIRNIATIPAENAGNRKSKGIDSWYEPLFIAQINAILKRNYKILKTEVTKNNGPTSVGVNWKIEKS